MHCKNTDYAAFFGAQSAQRARKYDSDAANANAALSAQLQYMFAVCRIAHYLKSMMRDKVGSFASPDSVEQFLNGWIHQYVTTDDNATQEVKARYPLREARVEVSEVPGRPGPLPRHRLRAPALPARRAVRLAAPGRRTAAVGARLTLRPGAAPVPKPSRRTP